MLPTVSVMSLNFESKLFWRIFKQVYSTPIDSFWSTNMTELWGSKYMALSKSVDIKLKLTLAPAKVLAKYVYPAPEGRAAKQLV